MFHIQRGSHRTRAGIKHLPICWKSIVLIALFIAIFKHDISLTRESITSHEYVSIWYTYRIKQFYSHQFTWFFNLIQNCVCAFIKRSKSTLLNLHKLNHSSLTTDTRINNFTHVKTFKFEKHIHPPFITILLNHFFPSMSQMFHSTIGQNCSLSVWYKIWNKLLHTQKNVLGA